MKYFAVVFAAVMALSIASPVEVEERQGDIINMVINMLKGFICNMQQVEVEERQMDIINMIINMVKGFLC
ncbi:hypothetical protein ACHWQZ_G016533 [Mnemiopsis leidyi]